jgi:AcrR family transcriptional regulator
MARVSTGIPAHKSPRTNSGILSPKSSQTRKRIIDSFFYLINTKKWYKIPVKELCARAKITRGTFYQYFDDIFDLMNEIQSDLLNKIADTYASLPTGIKSSFSYETFIESFDYKPPSALYGWFDFCIKNKKYVLPLFDPKNGDPLFVQKIKDILMKQINIMMDKDKMPRDALRSHFVKVFIELHFLAIRSWLETDKTLSTDDIINLLNTMRVGANYLAYKRLVKK